MFKKILIANRGEIACRIIETARRMGVNTVAVYSEADADARHVDMADEAVFIGPPVASQSYLVGEKIIAAAKSTGAEAIHPGYGFLSENASFMRDVEAAGLGFIGPGHEAIISMGDKIASKKLAKEAGVTTVPGHMGEIADAGEAAKIAKEIGFPVMIKASAGGGGKGMRVAWRAADVKEAFHSSQNEAMASFGDDRILIEKFIEEPRHIEIQIIADAFGNTLYLGERECSIQRRHQKVIEEAPSPFIDAKTRKIMGEQAVALAKAVNYKSAGTVEFIVDKQKNFYFLEMNTRLQVEHPVTEKVTGLDLVELMLRVACGEKLQMKQGDIKLTGWAIEARIYAEDPYRNFLPSIGRLTRYIEPRQNAQVRVDTGVYEGAEISTFYDPMIAKLISYGATRGDAITSLRHALNAYYIRGISHNIPFLAAVMAHPRMVSGDISTNFIADVYGDGFNGGTLNPEAETALVAVAAFLNFTEVSRAREISGQITGALQTPRRGEWIVRRGSKNISVVVSSSVGGGQVLVAGEPVEISTAWTPEQPVFEGEINGRVMFIEIDRLPMGYRLSCDGVARDLMVLTPPTAELYTHMPIKVAADTSNQLRCPMPGLIVSLNVKAGDEVKAGQALAVVEAMKMENTLRAERDGKIAKIYVTAGDSMGVDEIILEFE
jgi:propionyl-CoA carboxylase alpha subunit